MSNAVTVVANDDDGVVFLASPDGELYRSVARLATTAGEVEALYRDSRSPTLSADELWSRYGDQVATLRHEPD